MRRRTVIPVNTSRLVENAAPAIFVVLWSTGFIGAKLGIPHAEPFTFLALRMAITLAILVPIVGFLCGLRHDPRALAHSAVTGMLVHAAYLGGVFFAISRGMPAGISALVVALQPLLTTLFARLMLGERASRKQLFWLAIALGGVLLIISPRLTGLEGGEGITPVTLGACALAVFAIAMGTIYQKRFVTGLDVRVSTTAQYAGALLPLGILSLATETGEIDWTVEFIVAMAWLVLVLSIGAVMLLMFLIRRNSAASTASLFYLVPVSTAVIAYFLFGEILQPVQLAGMAVVILAVRSASRN